VELEKPAATMHGRATMRVVADQPSLAKRRHRAWLSSTGEPRRKEYAQKERETWSEEEESTERSSLVSSVVLRRAIPVDRNPTIAYRGERGVREVEAVLGARCSGWRGVVVAGTTNSGEDVRTAVAEASAHVL
jgi:hypothetical protein